MNRNIEELFVLFDEKFDAVRMCYNEIKTYQKEQKTIKKNENNYLIFLLLRKFVLFISIILLISLGIHINCQNKQIEIIKESNQQIQRAYYNKGYDDCRNEFKDFLLQNPKARDDFRKWLSTN